MELSLNFTINTVGYTNFLLVRVMLDHYTKLFKDFKAIKVKGC